MKSELSQFSVVTRFLRYSLTFFLGPRGRVKDAHLPEGNTSVPNDFFGICAASSENPVCDDYVIERLTELGTRFVRVDFGGEPETERFLDRLFEKGFKVCLHIVQPVELAELMVSTEVQDQWRQFVRNTTEKYGAKVDMIEVGSTVNRKKWSGYSLNTFLVAWRIAHEEITGKGVTIAGPNVTDFEPLYNNGLLGIMKHTGSLPDAHSDNLFVERVSEPEVFDHRVMGKTLGPVLKFNLIKKAAMLAAISRAYGVSRTICTHVAWSMRRINRLLTDAEEKHADYTARYCCLAAASGSLNRVYWGPMIGQREGFIDDGTTDYPQIPHVTYYGRANGQLADYKIRPAFNTFKNVIKLLSGTTYSKPLASTQGLEIHEFISGKKTLHAVWTTNGNLALTSDCYDNKTMAAAKAITRDGQFLDSVPVTITDSPFYLEWSKSIDIKRNAKIMEGVRIYNRRDKNLVAVKNEAWQGLCVVQSGNTDASALLPESMEKSEQKTIMRDRRNLVWSMPHPHDSKKSIVVKQARIRKWYKRILQKGKPSKSLRNWNGTNELLRRGINTSIPVAYYQSRRDPSLGDSFFVYEMFNETASVRQAFTAFAGGEQEFKGTNSSVFYEKLASFLNNMHDRGVYFRDLSAGNILYRTDSDCAIEFCLIDTARAHFYQHSLSTSKRLSDLKRILHPLNWECRNKFLNAYFQKTGLSVTFRTRLPCHIYDLKHWLKKTIKRKR